METKNVTNKTADSWTTRADEIFTKYGLTPNWDDSSVGQSVIMPVRKPSQSVKQQDSPKSPESDTE